MSQQLISRNADLKRLRDEGYDVSIKSNHLLVAGIPYVDKQKDVRVGTLVSTLEMTGDVTVKPTNHVVYFIGDHPCDKNGNEISLIKHGGKQSLGGGLDVNHSFSNKPVAGYVDYYHKITMYATIIAGPADALGSIFNAKNFLPITDDEDENSVFQYLDTSSSRSGIGTVSDKLKPLKIAIIGLGGTGSYILDLVAKTPVQSIHLFDGDRFSSHNAFRSPGAASVDELNTVPQKVIYFKDRYSKIHKNIIANNCFIDALNLDQLEGMDFVFICLDKSEVKREILKKLVDSSTPFIDVGMGIYLVDDALGGTLRVTASTDEKQNHVSSRVPLSDGINNDEYAQNIQIADLNALNAALAVIKWKKIFGFYKDFEKEHHSAYTIDGNKIDNEDNS